MAYPTPRWLVAEPISNPGLQERRPGLCRLLRPRECSQTPRQADCTLCLGPSKGPLGLWVLSPYPRSNAAALQMVQKACIPPQSTCSRGRDGMHPVQSGLWFIHTEELCAATRKNNKERTLQRLIYKGLQDTLLNGRSKV